jgi:hypothetical protein
MAAVVVGVSLAIGVGVAAASIGLDRDRAFYPTVLCVIASYYLLFAAMTGNAEVFAAEAALALLFVALAVLGFRRVPVLVVVGLAAHGAFDLVHHHLVDNAGVPAWWPSFCGGYDLGAAAFLAVQLRRR